MKGSQLKMMRKHTKYPPMIVLALASSLALVGCGDDDSTVTNLVDEGDAGDNSNDDDTLDDDAGDTSDDADDIPGESAVLTVIRTDYAEASIGILDRDGEVTNPSILSSQSVDNSLVTAIGSDLAMASAEYGPEGGVNLVSRYLADVITRLQINAADDMEVLGQVRIEPDSSNPYDMVYISDNSAWVTRFSSEVSDIVEIDPTEYRLTGNSIDLSEFTQNIDGVDVLPAPSRMTLIGDTLVIGLALIDAGYDVLTAGQLALVDINDPDTVTGFALPETSRNCGTVRRVPGQEDLIMITCLGGYRSENRRAEAGVYTVRIQDGAAELIASWGPEADDPLAVSNVLPLGAHRFAAIAEGVNNEVDSMYLVDMDTGEVELVFAAAAAYVIGRSFWDPQTQLVYVPDAGDLSAETSDGSGENGGIRRFRLEDDGTLSFDAFVLFNDTPLPPTQVYGILGRVDVP